MACWRLKMFLRFIPLSPNIKGFSQIAFWDNTSSEMKDSCNNLGFLSKLIGTSFVARGTADKGCQLSVLHPLVQVESSPRRRRSWNQWRGRSWRSHPGLPALGRRRNLRENGWEDNLYKICVQLNIYDSILIFVPNIWVFYDGCQQSVQRCEVTDASLKSKPHPTFQRQTYGLGFAMRIHLQMRIIRMKRIFRICQNIRRICWIDAYSATAWPTLIRTELMWQIKLPI